MRPLIVMRLSLAFALLLAAGLACSKSDTSAPPPLPIEQLPGALQKAFSAARAEAKELVGNLVSSLQSQDYPKAFAQMQTLNGLPNLTEEQRNVTARGFLTLNGLLQAAQEQGNQKAAETLQTYRANK